MNVVLANKGWLQSHLAHSCSQHIYQPCIYCSYTWVSSLHRTFAFLLSPVMNWSLLPSWNICPCCISCAHIWAPGLNRAFSTSASLLVTLGPPHPMENLSPLHLLQSHLDLLSSWDICPSASSVVTLGTPFLMISALFAYSVATLGPSVLMVYLLLLDLV